LWPDLEADAASVNVDTNVYRLRKLLGVEDALISVKGRIALNSMRCWVDAWSFEQRASQCMQAAGDDLLEKAREALNLYKGHVLDQEAEQPWALAFREQRALVLDNLSEPIYRRLIACLKETGEAAEALKVFRRCRELLSVVLGVQPSKETQALADTLRQ
jgi:DNA-binding SARP family transcriptional activator